MHDVGNNPRASGARRASVLLQVALLAVLLSPVSLAGNANGSLRTPSSPSAGACVAVVVSPAASALTQLAGREVRRYIWHAAGVLAPIVATPSAAASRRCLRVVVSEGALPATWHSAPLAMGVTDAGLAAVAVRVAALRPSEHLILSAGNGTRTAVVAGGDLGSRRFWGFCRIGIPPGPGK